MSEAGTSIIPKALVPSGVRDDRQFALAQTFGEALADIDLAQLTMADPLTVDARLLPFMIREFGAQEFIDPDLPEYIQRRILKNIWSLKALHGYDAGVKLGLELLGIKAKITHWHQMQPQGPANTHNIEIHIGEKLYDPDADVFLGDNEVRAAKRMISVCKRTSQDTTMRQGVAMKLPLHRLALVGRAATYTHVCARLKQAPTRSIAKASVSTVGASKTVSTAPSVIGQMPTRAKAGQTQGASGHAVTITETHSTKGGHDV